MKKFLLAGLVGLAPPLILAASADDKKTFSFPIGNVGEKPASELRVLSSKEPPGIWVVAKDSQASGGKALAQVSTHDTEDRYTLLVGSKEAADVTATVRLRPLSGRVARAAGIALRVKGAHAYALACIDWQTERVHFSWAKGGVPSRYEKNAHATLRDRYTDLSFQLQGTHFVISVDGQKLLEGDDSHCQGAGGFGLWTAADTVVHFESAKFEYAEK